MSTARNLSWITAGCGMDSNLPITGRIDVNLIAARLMEQVRNYTAKLGLFMFSKGTNLL